jgi:hypothetical protein
MDDGLRVVQMRACGAWVLPGDPTCASVARHLFRRVAEQLTLDRDTVDDGVTMVSELAANTLHVSRRQSPPVNPELWLYLRGSGTRVELVCKVFDNFAGWAHGNVPGRSVCRAPSDAMSGRGLEVVHALSGGRWGHHLTRSRLSGTGMRGKAVWFSLPAPLAGGIAGRRPPVTARDAMTELVQDLSSRGFGGKLVRADDPAADMAVLSIASGLTVWCRSAGAWLRAPGFSQQQQWSYYDLVEVGEQAVQAHETLIAPPADPFLLAGATKTGSLAAPPAAGPANPAPGSATPANAAPSRGAPANATPPSAAPADAASPVTAGEPATGELPEGGRTRRARSARTARR